MRKDILESVQLHLMNNIKPNYSTLAKQFDCDYRTVKRCFEKGKSHGILEMAKSQTAPSLLTAWVLKYNKYGTNAFKNNGKRQTRESMSKSQPSKIESQSIRELEIPLRTAQVERDCLKELRRLRETKQIKEKLK